MAKNAVFVRHIAKFRPTRAQISSDGGGLDASYGGGGSAVVPLALSWHHHEGIKE